MIFVVALFVGWSCARLVAALLGLHPAAARRAGQRRRTSPLLAWRGRAQEWVNRAGLELRAEQFVAALGVVGSIGGCVVWAATASPGLAIVAGGAVTGVIVVAHDRRARGRARARIEAWPDALRDLATNLRAPMSLHDALIELADCGPGNLQPVFARYRVAASTLDPGAALEMIREDLADPVSDRIIEILLLGLEQGSSVVVDILLDLAESTTSDLRLLNELDTVQLETKVEARVAAMLPFAVLGLLVVRSPEYRSFYATALGTSVILAGGVLVLIGLRLIARLGCTEPEERVLARGARS